MPVGPSTCLTNAVSTPKSSRASVAKSVKTSVPTQLTSVLEVPARAAATAWLEPLPPRMILKSSPRIDSPGSGSLSAKATRSIEIPPTTMSPPGWLSPVAI